MASSQTQLWQAYEGCGPREDSETIIRRSTDSLLSPDLTLAERARAYCERGLAYGRTDRDARAIGDYTSSIELGDPVDDAHAFWLCLSHFYRGWALEALGRHRAALEDFATALRIDAEQCQFLTWRDQEQPSQ